MLEFIKGIGAVAVIAGVAGFGFRFGERAGDDAYELTEAQLKNLRNCCEAKYKELKEERAQQAVRLVPLTQLPPEIVAAMNVGMPGAAGGAN